MATTRVFRLIAGRAVPSLLGFALGCCFSSWMMNCQQLEGDSYKLVIPTSAVSELESQGILGVALGSGIFSDELVGDIARLLSVDSETAWIIKSILYDGISLWATRSKAQPSANSQFTWQLSLDVTDQKRLIEIINARAKAYLSPEARSLLRAMLRLEFKDFFSASSILVRKDSERFSIRMEPSGRQLTFSTRGNSHSWILQIAEAAKHNDPH